MRKLTRTIAMALIAATVSMATTGQAMAADEQHTTMTICTGNDIGKYYSVGQQIKAML